MKHIPLQGQPCKLHEIHTLTWSNPGNYMKYNFQGQHCKLYERHTLTGTSLGQICKLIMKQGQLCKLYGNTLNPVN